jgi:hypothetical protein
MSPEQLKTMGTSGLRRLMKDWANKPDWIALIKAELSTRGIGASGGPLTRDEQLKQYQQQGIFPANQPSPTGQGEINQFYPDYAKPGAGSYTSVRPLIQSQPVPPRPGTTPGIGAVGPISSSQLPQVNHGREAYTPGEALNMTIDWENQLRADDTQKTQQGLSALYNAQGIADSYAKDSYGLMGKADSFIQQNQGIAEKQFGDESKFIKNLGANQYQRVRDQLGNNVGGAISDMAGRGLLNSSTKYSTIKGYQNDAQRQTLDVDASQAGNWIDHYNRRGQTMMGLNNQRGQLQGQVASLNAMNSDRATRYGAQVADYLRAGRQGVIPGIPGIAGKDAQHGPSIGSAVLGSVAGPIAGTLLGGLAGPFGAAAGGMLGGMFGGGGGQQSYPTYGPGGGGTTVPYRYQNGGYGR